MAKITTIDIKNDMTKQVISAMRDKIKTAMMAIGNKAEGFAKDECPVDTGRLRNSISNEYEEDETALYVGTNVEYAVYVEYGDFAHRVGKKHFLRDSIANHGDYYKGILEAALKS